MAATAHPQATMLAIDILREGGNAVDAGIAAMALLCVVEPQATGIGGDCFALYAPSGRRPVGLNGSGRAPADASLDWFIDRGIEELAIQSPHAVTVPGAVDAWCRLHEDYGSLPFERLLAPAIRAAEDGYVVLDRVARDWSKLAFRLHADEVSRQTMLVRGEAPSAGSVHRQPNLATALREIAKKGRSGFYAGWVAEDVVSRLRELGAAHTLDDLTATRCTYVEPISTSYRGYEVCEIPPNSQGITALMMLNALSGFTLPECSPAERVHLLSEVTKAAYRRRDALLGDPDVAGVEVSKLLSADESDRLRAEIDLAKISRSPAKPPFEHRDTTYLCVVDRDGNALSLINSLFEGFGTGISTRKAGILLQNRGSSFRLTRGHPNAFGPGKRPMHTIIPGMLLREGLAVMPFGVMGGHYQPVGHVELLTNLIDYGMNPQDALAAPRSFAYDASLQVEPSAGEQVLAELRTIGHDVIEPASPLGGGQAIWMDRDTGALCGGTDPRKDGLAFGF